MADLSIYKPTNFLHTQECMSKYRPGGFHPVCLGDIFQDGRYKIYHKLGWGGFSTVWLAKDKKDMRWVSIKILTAESTEQSRELSTLQFLETHSQGDVCRPIVQLLDHFFHKGPNGTHQCLVFELLGPTLDIVINDFYIAGDHLEPETIIRLSEQLLKAIAFLHNFGYTHGDISGRNIAFTSKRLSLMTEECLFGILGRPESVELTRLDGQLLSESLPSQLVKAVDWVDWIDEDEEDLRIIDLGGATLQGEENKRLDQPSSLQAPETIFTRKFDSRLDLWRAGIIIYSLIFRTLPFHQYLGRLDILIEQMAGFVEELPTEWQQKWDHIMRKFRPAQEPVTRKSQSLLSKLEAKFDENSQVESLKPLLPVIRGLMRFRPSDRISISDAIDLIRWKTGEEELIQETDDNMDD